MKRHYVSHAVIACGQTFGDIAIDEHFVTCKRCIFRLVVAGKVATDDRRVTANMRKHKDFPK